MDGWNQTISLFFCMVKTCLHFLIDFCNADIHNCNKNYLYNMNDHCFLQWMLCCFANVHNNSLPLIPIADYLIVLYVCHFLLLNLFCPSVSSVFFPSVLLSSVCPCCPLSAYLFFFSMSFCPSFLGPSAPYPSVLSPSTVCPSKFDIFPSVCTSVYLSIKASLQKCGWNETDSWGEK